MDDRQDELRRARELAIELRIGSGPGSVTVEAVARALDLDRGHLSKVLHGWRPVVARRKVQRGGARPGRWQSFEAFEEELRRAVAAVRAEEVSGG